MKILIVGAGPTGLTTAVELARRGHVPTIIERHATPSTLSRAVGIQQRTMELLAPSGVDRAIAAEAVEFAGLIPHDHARPLARIPLGTTPESRLYGLAQDRTEAHLRDGLARLGGHVRFGVTLTGLTQDGTGVTVETTDGTARYDIVIGADGVHSAVRHALGIDFPGYTLGDTWSIADVEARGWADPHWAQLFLLDAGAVAIVVPMAETRFRAISSTPDALAVLPRKLDVTHLNRTDSFSIEVRQVNEYQVGRVFLAGDAAHCHSPVGGRGMNLGMADGADLAERLASGETAGYSAARHAEGKRIIAMSEEVRQIAQSPRRITRSLLDAGLGLAGHFPPLARRIGQTFATA